MSPTIARELADVIANRLMVASLTWFFIGAAVGAMLACYYFWHRYRDGIEWQHRREDYIDSHTEI